MRCYAVAVVICAFTSHAQPQTPPTSDVSAAPVPTSVTTSVEPPAEVLTPEERFRRGKRYFEYRDCPAATATLIDLAVPGFLADAAQQLEVHRMLGICYALADQRREASREFSSLLSLDPDHQLDPFEVPPPVLDIFEAQKTTMKASLDELRKARERAREDGEDGAVLVERVTTVRTTPWATAFLPFGIAQGLNGDGTKAVVIGTAQAAGLLANITGYWGSVVVVSQAQNGNVDYTQEQANLENAFWYTHLAGGGVFLVSYAVGVADALWNFEREAVTASKATRRPLTAAELRKLRRIERAPVNEEAPREAAAPPSTLPPSTPVP
jgi:hypothetical protein